MDRTRNGNEDGRGAAAGRVGSHRTGVQVMDTEGLTRIGRMFVEGYRIDEALKEAARQARLQHKRAGLPIVVYRDGNIVWVSADEIDASGRLIKRP